MKLLYFAWLRERVGLAEEEPEVPAEIGDVAGLIRWLAGRGDNFARAFADLSVVRVAVNQEYVGLDQEIAPGDEIAFFPPLTGG